MTRRFTTSSLLSFALALLFVLSLAVTGCTSALTGPEIPLTEQPVTVDAASDMEAPANDANDSGTTPGGAGANEVGDR